MHVRWHHELHVEALFWLILRSYARCLLNCVWLLMTRPGLLALLIAVPCCLVFVCELLLERLFSSFMVLVLDEVALCCQFYFLIDESTSLLAVDLPNFHISVWIVSFNWMVLRRTVILLRIHSVIQRILGSHMVLICSLNVTLIPSVSVVSLAIHRWSHQILVWHLILKLQTRSSVRSCIVKLFNLSYFFKPIVLKTVLLSESSRHSLTLQIIINWFILLSIESCLWLILSQLDKVLI